MMSTTYTHTHPASTMLLTGRSRPPSRPPRSASGSWCAGSGGTAGPPWLSYTGSSAGRSRGPPWSLAFKGERERERRSDGQY